MQILLFLYEVNRRLRIIIVLLLPLISLNYPSKSITMKSATEKVHYFSAYPLKALNLPEEEYQSELRIRSTATVKTVNRVRVWAMANPYKEQDFLQEVKKDDVFNVSKGYTE
jgi:hypothetical protein